MKRVNVYCPACGHPGKARSADELGECTRCGHGRVRGVPPTGQPVGRPRLTPFDLLRRHAEALHELADELERASFAAKDRRRWPACKD
jgi:hypothetical protein